MLATINSAASSGREVCGPNSRFGHTLSRPTSFLIRDILGKCNDLVSSDSGDEHNEQENSKAFSKEKHRITSEEEQEKIDSSKTNPSSVLPTLCCRECITAKDERQNFACDSRSPNPCKIEDGESHQDSHKCFSSRSPQSQSPSENGLEYEDKASFHFEKSDALRNFSPRMNFPHFVKNPLFPNGATSPEDLLNPKKFELKNASSSVEVSSSSEDECFKDQSDRFSSANSKDLDHEKLERSLFDKLKGTSVFNQNCLYGGLYPSAQNLIDLNYAFSMRAASAFRIPQLAMPYFNAYRNSSHHNFDEHHFRLLQNSSKSESVTSVSKTLRFEPYSRYRLLDWPQGRNFSSRNSAFFTLNQQENLASINQNSISDRSKHERRGLSLKSASPAYSEHSQHSPLPEKRPVQLPAYFRSRLGDSGSSDDTSCSAGGKAKKCRRSRTVFTELQVRIFEILFNVLKNI